MICDINGQVPTFGYPHIQFSPPQAIANLTDAQVWKHAIVSDGAAIKNLAEDEHVMKSTSQLKLELTERQDRAEARAAQLKEQKKQNKMSGLSDSQSISNHYPIGAKCHIYKEMQEDQQKNQKNQWKNIYALMGVQIGQNQNIISEILDSYYKQNETMDRVYTKFQRGERIEKDDLKDDQDAYSARVSLNFTRAVGDHPNKPGNRIRFSNIKSALNRSTNHRSGTNVTQLSRLAASNNSQMNMVSKDGNHQTSRIFGSGQVASQQ